MPTIDPSTTPQGRGSRFPAPFDVHVEAAVGRGWEKRSEQPPLAGECAGFKAGDHDGHSIQNRSSAPVTLLVVGTRNDADHGEYPDIDLEFGPGARLPDFAVLPRGRPAVRSRRPTRSAGLIS